MRSSYRDIKAIVLTRIRANIWPPGANLPGEIELAKEFGCARATVNRAMRELVDDGILERNAKPEQRLNHPPRVEHNSQSRSFAKRSPTQERTIDMFF